MKKKLLAFAAITLMSACVMSGCMMKKTLSLTYTVSTGDNIKIAWDQESGYAVDGKNPFAVSKDDKEILSGTFLTEDEYSQYYDLVKAGDESVEIIKEDEKDGNNYIMYRVSSDETQEHDFLLMVKDSSTGVVMGSLEGQEDAEACFSALTFTKEK